MKDVKPLNKKKLQAVILNFIKNPLLYTTVTENSGECTGYGGSSNMNGN